MTGRDRLAAALLLAGCGLAVTAVLVARQPDGPPATAATATSTWSADGVDLDQYAAELLAAADEAHRAAGLPAWEDAPCAHGPALARAQALVGEDLEHAPLDPVLAACAPSSTAAENLSRAAAAPQDVADAWMGSPGHRANIEEPTLTAAATACVRQGPQVLCSLVLVGP